MHVPLGQHESSDDVPARDLPVRIRKRTDSAGLALVCLFPGAFFLLLLITMGGAGGLNGYQRIVRGLDYAGNVCNGKLFFPDLAKKEVAICVDTCPTTYDVKVCAPSEGVANPPCWQSYPSRPVLRFCLPVSKSTGAQVDLADAVVSGGITGLVYGDLHTASPVVVAAALVATLTGFLFLIAVQACAQCMVTTSVAGTVASTLVLGAWLIMQPAQRESAPVTGLAPITFASPFASQLHGLGVTALVTAGCLTICFVAGRDRLGSAVRLYKEASAAVASAPSLVLVPVVKALLTLVTALLWASTVVYAVSAGALPDAPVPVATSAGTVPTRTLRWDLGMRHTIGLSTLTAVWIVFFFSGTSDFIIAHVVGSWYFSGARALWKADQDNAVAASSAAARGADVSGDSSSSSDEEGATAAAPSAPRFMEVSDAGRVSGKEDESVAPPASAEGDDVFDAEEERAWNALNPVLRALGVAWGRHAGSLAIFALLLTLATSLRLAAEYVDRRVRRERGSRLARAVAACVQCFARAFLRLARFAQRQVIIVIALYGEPVAPAARRATETMRREAFRVALLSNVSAWFRIVGSLFVCVTTTTLAYACLVSAPAYVDALTSPLIPTVAIAFVSYAVGATFMGVVDMSTSTLLHCVAVDSALHGAARLAPLSLSQSVDAESGKFSEVQYAPTVA